MEYRILGKSDLKISRIGFGAMSLSPEDPDAERILKKSIDDGINYFDTADIYQNGLNERFIGKVLKSKRKEIIIATKVGNSWRADGSGLDWIPSKKYILNEVENSLKRLQTNYIDLYQLHGGTIQDPIDEIIEAFELLQSQGKIRYYGISSIRPNVIREYVKKSSIVSVMMQYSILDRRPEEDMLDLLLKNNIGVLARGAVAKGLLISKPANSYLNYTADQVKKMQDLLRHMFKTNGLPNGNAAIQFVLNNQALTSVVVGIRTIKHLNDAILAITGVKINKKQLAEIMNVLPVNTYSEHR